MKHLLVLPTHPRSALIARWIGAAVALAPLVCASAAGTAWAHDYWIEPSAQLVEVGSSVDLALRVGHRGDAQPVLRVAERIEAFEVVHGKSRTPVPGEEGADPAGTATLEQPGWHIVVLRSRHSYSELPAAKFHSYLREEGLEAVQKARVERGEADQPGREIYSRCAKSLLFAGTPAEWGKDAKADREVGLPLEIVLESAPGAPRWTARLTYQGKPLKGAQLSAMGPDHKEVNFRTDANGRVSIPLENKGPAKKGPAKKGPAKKGPANKGPWMLSAVHMVALPEGANVQWESFWASLTVERR